ncbi:MAG: hypothetical protein HY913_14395 [Desulfomonile tiedjei]|nr:hypothetical protein [Desulfomonile tiedjei]
MKRIIIVLAVWLVPFSAAANDIVGSLVVSAVPAETFGSTAFRFGQIRITPSGRLGYQRMGVDARIPVPFELSIKGGEGYRGDPARLKLPEANLWIAEASVTAQVNPNLAFFTSVAGNFVQSFLGPTLGGTVVPNRPSEWRERQLEWWEIEVGATFNVWSPFGLIGGLRWDHFDLAFRDARGVAGASSGTYKNVNLEATDLSSEIWIPYAGFGLLGRSYKAYIIASPFAATDIKVLTRMTANVLPSNNFSGEAEVALNKPAGFVEARFEYDARVSPEIRLGLWSKGSWLATRGTGKVEGKYTTNHPDLTATPLGGESMTFSRYNVAAGLALKLSF